MSKALEWLQLPVDKVSDTLRNKQLTAKLVKIVEIARSLNAGDDSSETISTKTKVGISEFWKQIHLGQPPVQSCNQIQASMGGSFAVSHSTHL